jgi:hypothetical protein
VVDFDGNEIHVGDVVTVLQIDWSMGTASWMRHRRAVVKAIGRRRITVTFEGRRGTTSLPPLGVQVIAA